MNQVVKKTLSLVLLSVFLIASDPGHLLHQLAGHDDTVDRITKTQAVSTKHIHCETSQFSLSPYLQLRAPLLVQPFASTTSFFLTAGLTVIQACPPGTPGRAPPVKA